ncbi:MAG: radical SAM protein [Acidobacteria bacterium]|nr:radical SAM protein [Acidobacteriota bacterium]
MNALRSRPLEVILDTTERCNLKCKMCYFSAVDRLQFPPYDRNLSRTGMMPLETFGRVAADLFPRAHKVALGCAAEPLVHPKFIDIVRESARYRIPDLWFPTNLLPLTPPKAEAICEAGVRTVAVSMDGTRAETYEAIRVGATYARFRRVLDLLNDVRRGTATRLRLIFVWMRTNRADLADLPRFAEEVGARELDVRFVAPTAHVTAEDELLDGEDPGALRAELASAAEDAAARGLKLVSYPDFDDGGPIGLRGHLLRWRAGLYDRRRLLGRARTAVAGCAWPGHTVVVRPNGAVSPCIFWEDQPIGLYPETSLAEVERSPLLSAITDGLRTGNPCGTCRTCTERKHALYFRLQWRQQQEERLEQLSPGPGASGLVDTASPPSGDARSDTSSVAVEDPAASDAVSLGARTFWSAPSATPRSGEPESPFPTPATWLPQHAPTTPHNRVLLLGDATWAPELLRTGFATQVDVATVPLGAPTPLGAPAFWPAPSAMPRSGEPESQPHPINHLLLDPRRPELPTAAYQAVVSLGGFSAHLRLERLLIAVLDALEPGGRLIVDDYVGPARHQWNDRSRAGAAAAEAFRRLPAAARRFDRLPLPPIAGDCARAIRSRDLGRLVRTGFRVESTRPYGGDLIAPLGASVDWSRLSPDELRRLTEGSGRSEAHYALIVARPHRGAARRLARLRYRFGPKVRRLFIYEPRRARDLVLQTLRGQV